MPAVLSPAPRTTTGGVIDGGVTAVLLVESSETVDARTTVHDVIDAAVQTIVRTAPPAASGTIDVLLASRADALAVLALAVAPVRVTDTSVTPTLDRTCVLESVEVLPAKTGSRMWLARCQWRAVTL